MHDQRSPLVNYRTKTQLIYEELRRAILAGEHPPGSRVVADQIAEAYGTSKVPVREAIVRLAGEGWLELNPHIGAIVPRLAPDEILETAIVRAALESRAVRFATPEHTETDLEALRDLLGRMDAAAAQDAPEYPGLNFEFHARICGRCPYALLRQLAASMAERSLRFRTVRFVPAYLPQSQREHWALWQALGRRDAEAAEHITRDHIERAGRLLWTFATRRAARSRDPGVSSGPERPDGSVPEG